MISSLEALQTSNTSAAPEEANRNLGQVEFLSLLLTQLKNQDPLEPMEATEFTTQLAQFSALDEMRSTSTGIESMVGLMGDQTQGFENLQGHMASLSNLTSLSLLGKEVEYAADKIYHEENSVTDIYVPLTEDATVQVKVYDQAGALCWTSAPQAMPEGVQSVKWDGWDGTNNVAKPTGFYRYEVEAYNADSMPVSVQLASRGRVDGVSFENGVTCLSVNGRRLLLPDVQSIH